MVNLQPLLFGELRYVAHAPGEPILQYLSKSCYSITYLFKRPAIPFECLCDQQYGCPKPMRKTGKHKSVWLNNHILKTDAYHSVELYNHSVSLWLQIYSG